MSIVALHTQALVLPEADAYLELLTRALQAARLNNSFPERRQLQNTVDTLRDGLRQGVYGELYVDARSGLPNLASFTRVATDHEVAAESLARMGKREELLARRDEAEVFARLAAKRAYYEKLQKLELAPVDHHRVLLRRHDPGTGTAAFRIELTKLDASGVYLRLMIELTQVSSLWRRKVIDLDEDGETAAANEAFRGTVYRCADLDAETLFVRLHGIEGVRVERVARGIIGPALFSLPVGGGVQVRRTVEAPDDALGRAWHAWSLGPGAAETERPELLIAFATDSAAEDIREEKSNDPLSPLLAQRLAAPEAARYRALREQYRFKVFKDRKFVATAGLKAVAQAVCTAAGTQNILYELRSPGR
ncbi:MAG: hypothetical protein IPO88_14660 [Nannocystis sp.]|uniref:hypothetical protein n=1 Tax=Nannocystis sp. TaxID=1962667 RepID=UPI002428F80A|nr:hypothetical protein [Nannocystis sp.]MBK9754715.1 hypothetical protein [Nannocystis sp.]